MAGFALLSCGDAVIKTMAGEWAPTAIAMTRYVVGALGLGALLWRFEGPAAFAMPAPGVQLLRGFAVGMATVGFFSAVFVLPLATATSITFTSPMLTALLAALVLGEPARRETLIASAVAFIGVLVVLRPNFLTAGWAALFPLIAAAGMSILMIGNRFVAGKGSVLAMQFYVAAFAAVLLVLATVALHFAGIERFAVHSPDWSVLARCVLVAGSASGAHWLIYIGTTRAGAATVAPMTYVQLLVATLFGWLCFGNHPDLSTLAGAAIIIGAGLYLWRAGRVRDVAGTD